MKGKVLIIEDEPDLADLIRMYLKDEGISSRICLTGEEGLEEIKKEKYDLVSLDINLPEMDGFEFLQSLRRESKIPVIIVSARQADEDIIMGLGIGADEFVAKPFSPKVLAARVRALLRRTKVLGEEKKGLVFGTYKLDIEAFTLRKGEERIPLSLKEFEVLLYLAERPGQAFRSETIYREVWGGQYGDISSVAVYIQRLRKKIENNPGDPEYIQTIHGMGYCFNPDVLEKDRSL